MKIDDFTVYMNHFIWSYMSFQ